MVLALALYCATLLVAVQSIPFSSVEQQIPPFSTAAITVAKDLYELVDNFVSRLETAEGSVSTKDAICKHFMRVADKQADIAVQNSSAEVNNTLASIRDSQSLNLTELFELQDLTDFVSLNNIKIPAISHHCDPLRIELQSQVYADHQTIIPGVLELHNLSITVIIEAELQQPVVLIVVSGNWMIAGDSVQLSLTYNHDTNRFILNGKIDSTQQNLQEIVSELTSLSLPLAAERFSSSFPGIKIAGSVDSQADGTIVISASIDSVNTAFLVLQRTNGTLEAAVAVDIASASVRDVIESLTRHSVPLGPSFGSLTLPRLAIAVSTGPISSELVQECFNSSETLSCYDNSIPSGVSGFVHLSATNIYKLSYHNNSVGFTTKRGALSVRSLLKLLPLLDVSSTIVPAAIRDIWSVNIIDFGFDLTKSTAFITAEFKKTLSFFNNLLFMNTSSVTLTEVDDEFGYDILGNIRLLDTLLDIQLSYSPISKLFTFFTDINAPSLSIGDLVSSLTSLSLPLAGEFQSSYQKIKIAGSLDDHFNGVIIVSAYIDSQHSAYLILQRDNDTLEAAVAVDIASVPISDVFDSLTGQHISSAPFISSLMLPEVGLALSTGPISSELVQQCFNNSLTLSCYEESIPSGLSAFIRLSASNIFEVAYHNNTASFSIKKGYLNIRDLLTLIPVVSFSSIQLPTSIRGILDVNVRDIGIDLIDETMYITAEFERQLSFFNNLLLIDASSVTLTAENGNFAAYEIQGTITVKDVLIDMRLSYSPDTDMFTFLSELSVPSFSIGDFISEMTSLSLPMAGRFNSSHQRIKIAGFFDDQSNGVVVISASIDSVNNAFLVLQRDNGSLEAAVAVDIASAPLSDIIKSLTGQDISSLPFIESLTLPEMGLAVSTGPISSQLLQNCLDNSLTLRCYGDNIPVGLSGFVRLSKNNIFKLAYRNNSAYFTIKTGSLNIRNLLRLIPVVDLSTIQLPFVIKDVLDIDILDFGFDLVSSTTFITAEFGRTLSFFNGLFSMETPSVTLTAADGFFSYDIMGNISLLNALIEMKLSFSPNSKGFTFLSDIHAPSLSIRDVVSELTSLSLPQAAVGKFSSSHQKMKIAGSIDDHLNGVAVISAAIDSVNNAFLVLQRDNGTLEAAVAVDIASAPLSDFIESLTGQDVSSLPFIESLTLPEMGLAVSTGLISSEFVQECFNNSLTLRCYGDSIPPGFSGFIRLFSNSIFEVTYHNDSILFRIKEGSLNVRDLLGLIPIIEVSNIQLPPVFGDILEIDIKDFGFDLVSNVTYITAGFERTLSFFNNLLSVDVSSVTLTLADGKFGYDFRGNISLGNTLINIKFNYSPISKLFTFFTDVSAPSLRLEDLVSSLTSLSLPVARQFRSSRQRVKIAGSVDADQSNGIIIISVTIDSIHRAFLILERDNGTLETAVAVDIASAPLSDVIQSVTRLDVSSVPFIGSVTLPEMGVAVSSDQISSQLLDQCFSNTMMLECYDDTIPSGFSGFVDFEFASDAFSLTYSDEIFGFSTKSGELNVREALRLVLSQVDIQRINLPNIFEDVFDIGISDFGMNLTSGDFFINLEFGNTLRIFGGFIQIISPSVSLQVSLPENNVSIELSNGSLVFGEVDFSFSITNEESGKYSLSASTNYISLQSILSSFSAKLLPSHFQRIIQSLPFLNVGIRDFSMIVPLDTTFEQVYLSGKPAIGGFSLVDMSATVFKDTDGSIDMVYELDFGDTNLADVLGEIAPFAKSILRLIPFLNQDLDISILFSPVQKNDVKLRLDDVRSLVTKKGITVKAEIPFPSDTKCDLDLFCVVAKRLLPSGTVLYIDTTIYDETNFDLVASLTGNINLPGGLTITHVGVEIRVGEEDTSIGIIGKIALQNPRLDFTVRIYLSSTGIVLEMIAAGCWRSAFGLPIDICDVHGSIGFGATAITEISIGGEIRVGGLLGCDAGRPLVARGYVGLNTIDPKNNYFFASFPQGLTISNLLEVFCIGVSGLPPPIADSGLKPGFQSSFTAGTTGKSIPEIDVYIPPGFQLNGTLSILGFTVSANITISHTEGLYAAVALKPLEVGSVFQMYASSDDRTRGPYLIADLRTGQVPSVEASGYLNVLGFSVEASLLMTSESISTTIEGSILGIVEAGITLTANYGSSFSDSQFEVEGYFKSSFHRIIEDVIKDAADFVADTADIALGAAQDVLDAASEVFDAASAAFRRAREKLDRAQRKFDSGVAEVNRWIAKADNICRTRSCRRICVPGCGSCSCSWRRCGCRCSSCYSRITDPVCKAANLACEVLKAPILVSLRLARETVRTLGQSLNIAKEAFRFAERASDAASSGLRDASDGLEYVKRKFREGLRVLAEIANFGLNNIFALEEITYQASLSGASLGRFSLSVRAIILGNSVTVSLDVDINDIVGTITRPLADRLGFGSIVNRIG